MNSDGPTFIGFCGVLQNGRPDNPMWLRVWAGILVLAALGLACCATFLVGRVAWPSARGRSIHRRRPRGGPRARGSAPQAGAPAHVRRRRDARPRDGLGLVAAAPRRETALPTSSRCRWAGASACAERSARRTRARCACRSTGAGGRLAAGRRGDRSRRPLLGIGSHERELRVAAVGRVAGGDDPAVGVEGDVLAELAAAVEVGGELAVAVEAGVERAVGVVADERHVEDGRARRAADDDDPAVRVDE